MFHELLGVFGRPGDYGQCPASYSLVQTVLTPHGREIARLYGLSRQKRLEVVLSPDVENVKSTKWRLASSLVVRAQMAFGVLESELHAVERVPAEGRSPPTQFIYKPLTDFLRTPGGTVFFAQFRGGSVSSGASGPILCDANSLLISQQDDNPETTQMAIRITPRRRAIFIFNLKVFDELASSGRATVVEAASIIKAVYPSVRPKRPGKSGRVRGSRASQLICSHITTISQTAY